MCAIARSPTTVVPARRRARAASLRSTASVFISKLHLIFITRRQFIGRHGRSGGTAFGGDQLMRDRPKWQLLSFVHCLGASCRRSPTLCKVTKLKVHSRSVDPQENRRNYLITLSIRRRSSLHCRSFDIYISAVGPKTWFTIRRTATRRAARRAPRPCSQCLS